jgi:hypothetical protein
VALLRETKSSGGRELPLGDVAALLTGGPAFSPKALEALGSVLLDHGELLPLAAGV